MARTPSSKKASKPKSTKPKTYKPKAYKPKKKTTGRTKPRSVRPGRCGNCGCSEKDTGLWRNNPDDPGNPNNMLCNACGLWVVEKHIPRPKDYPRRKPRAQLPTPDRSPSPSSDTEDDNDDNLDAVKVEDNNVDGDKVDTDEVDEHKPETDVAPPASAKNQPAKGKAKAKATPKQASHKTPAPKKAAAKKRAPSPAAAHNTNAVAGPSRARTRKTLAQMTPSPEPEAESKTEADSAPEPHADRHDDVLEAATLLMGLDRHRRESSLSPTVPSPAQHADAELEDEHAENERAEDERTERAEHHRHPRADAQSDDEHVEHHRRQPRRQLNHAEVDFSAYHRGYTPAWMSGTPRASGAYSAVLMSRRYAPVARPQMPQPQPQLWQATTQHATRAQHPAHAYDNGAASYPTPPSIMSTPDLRVRALEDTPAMYPADWFFGGDGPGAMSPPPMALPEAAGFALPPAHRRHPAYPGGQQSGPCPVPHHPRYWGADSFLM